MADEAVEDPWPNEAGRSSDQDAITGPDALTGNTKSGSAILDRDHNCEKDALRTEENASANLSLISNAASFGLVGCAINSTVQDCARRAMRASRCSLEHSEAAKKKSTSR